MERFDALLILTKLSGRSTKSVSQLSHLQDFNLFRWILLGTTKVSDDPRCKMLLMIAPLHSMLISFKHRYPTLDRKDLLQIPLKELLHPKGS